MSEKGSADTFRNGIGPFPGAIPQTTRIFYRHYTNRGDLGYVASLSLSVTFHCVGGCILWGDLREEGPPNEVERGECPWSIIIMNSGY